MTTMAGSTMRPAQRRGLADEVADRIREAIFDGAFPPGAPLREVELAANLDVSRGPVREALVKLEREGLVQLRWHRGASVTTLSGADAEELYTLRGAPSPGPWPPPPPPSWPASTPSWAGWSGPTATTPCCGSTWSSTTRSTAPRTTRGLPRPGG